MRASAIWIAAIAAIGLSTTGFAANSKAYVLVSQYPSGTMSTLNPSAARFGPTDLIPTGGTLIAVAPATHDIWEVVAPRNPLARFWSSTPSRKRSKAPYHWESIP